MFTLYTTALSANGRKVLAAARQLGLEPDVREVNVYSGQGQAPEYLAINPAGKIPTLVEGDFVLPESNAILQYLCEAHGDFRLFSRDARERAAISSWLFWESAHWQPALVPVLSAFVGHKLLPDVVPAPSGDPDWESELLAPLLRRLDAHLADHLFLAQDALTIADFSVAGMGTYFRSCGFPFASFPHLAAWYGRVDALEAWSGTEADLWK